MFEHKVDEVSAEGVNSTDGGSTPTTSVRLYFFLAGIVRLSLVRPSVMH